MTKLSLSHALAQSVKISLFESLISSTIEQTQDLPDTISSFGKIRVSHRSVLKEIGALFVLRMDINSVGSVVDSPEVFWVRQSSLLSQVTAHQLMSQTELSRSS